MSDDTLDRLMSLPDAEIEKYLPPGVPLKLYDGPIEQLTDVERSIATSHRIMLACHAELCAALHESAERRRKACARWKRRGRVSRRDGRKGSHRGGGY
jgi:hypothetical protein